LIYFYDKAIIKEFFYIKNRNSFRTGQRILIDQQNMSAHEFSIDSKSKLLLNDAISTLRIIYNNGKVFVQSFGYNMSVKIDGKVIPSGKKMPLSNDSHLMFGAYVFKLELKPEGIFAKDIIIDRQR